MRKQWSSEQYDPERLGLDPKLVQFVEKLMDNRSNEILEAEIDRLGRVIYLCDVGMKICGIGIGVFLASCVMFLSGQRLGGGRLAALGAIIFGLNIVLLLSHKWIARHWTWIPRAK